jgi:hypothetical protein
MPPVLATVSDVGGTAVAAGAVVGWAAGADVGCTLGAVAAAGGVVGFAAGAVVGSDVGASAEPQAVTNAISTITSPKDNR